MRANARARLEYRGIPASGRREVRWSCLTHANRMQHGPWLDVTPDNLAKARAGMQRHDLINHPR